MDGLFLYLLVVNVIGFVMFGVDKFKAKRDLWRISEKALFAVALSGGVVGAMVGMHVFRHKTKHTSFVIGMPCILVLWIVLLVYLEMQLA